jgi:hypothetical protein
MHVKRWNPDVSPQTPPVPKSCILSTNQRQIYMFAQTVFWLFYLLIPDNQRQRKLTTHFFRPIAADNGRVN